MPAVGHLPRLRRRFAGCGTIPRASVTADDLDLRVLAQPRDYSIALAIGQEVDDLTALEIHNDAAVAVAAAPCEVIDADHPRGRRQFGGRITTP